MSRFPQISETFILYEIAELERAGLSIEIFPLMRQREDASHPEAQALAARAHYSRFVSLPVLAAQFHWLRRRPLAYLGVWWQVLRENVSSPGFLARALAVVPQAAYFARRMHDLGVARVHAHYATHPALAAYVIRRLAGLPYSFTAHAHDIYVDRAMLAEKIAQASAVITISDYNRRFLCDLYGPAAAAKLHVVHCGVDLSVFRPRPVPPASGQFTIVCVASLQDYKGHAYLIEACAELRARGVAFRCLLIGDGQERRRIEAQIARLGLADAVALLGRQPRPRVNELLGMADVLALPSITTHYGKKEGIPVALMEALAVGLPVVATAISGVPELIDDGRSGLLVPERDSAALAQAILRLHGDPELRRRLGAAGREKVLREFDLRQTTAQLAALLGSNEVLPDAARQAWPNTN
jgi:glycosyltransferase involved in cell wall biosynthesis